MWDLHKNVLILKTKKEWIHLNKQKKVESLKNGLIKTKNKKSVDGWSCVPSLLFTWGQTMVEVMKIMVQFSSVQSLSRVWLFATPWIPAHQVSLSITISQSSLKLTSIELVMPFSHLILCRPLFLLPLIPPSIKVFSNELTLCMRWPKYWSFSFSIIPSKVHPGLIFFRMDWLDVLTVTVKNYICFTYTSILLIKAKHMDNHNISGEEKCTLSRVKIKMKLLRKSCEAERYKLDLI